MKKKGLYASVITIFTAIILVLVTIGLSFAWYQAIIANSIIDELYTSGVNINLNTSSQYALTPPILKEGVINNTNNNESILNDPNYESYIETEGNIIVVEENVKVILGNYVVDNYFIINSDEELQSITIEAEYTSEETTKTISQTIELSLVSDTTYQYMIKSSYMLYGIIANPITISSQGGVFNTLTITTNTGVMVFNYDKTDTSIITSPYFYQKAYNITSRVTEMTSIDNYVPKSYEGVTLSIGMKYRRTDGNVVDLLNFSDYFNLEYAIDDDEVFSNYAVPFNILGSGDHILKIKVSYKLPDELLPFELVNSSCITIYIKGELS